MATNEPNGAAQNGRAYQIVDAIKAGLGRIL